jgi:hypothetical protein
LPKESHYKVIEVEVVQFRLGKKIQAKLFSSNLLDLIAFQTKSKDKFQISVKRVQRVGTIAEDVSPIKSYFQFSLL